MSMVGDWLETYRSARVRLSVATPTAIRAALISSGETAFVDDAVDRLHALDPALSARRVATAGQIACGIALAAVVAIGLTVAPLATAIALNLIGAVFFFGVTAVRFVAAGFAGRRRLVNQVFAPQADDELPVYSVLVPLFREAGMVRDLIAALDRLDWPRDRLDIKLIVEADDPATEAAVRAAVGGPPYEIVVVPPSTPRTKPKALAFALPFARGEFVTIYDAEDRPHPRQLRVAYTAFRLSRSQVACLQAPIVIDERDDGVLARLFAVEYAAIFDGLLPALAALGLPMPLGGTSNHFRREALEQVGGWDPFNVTEDADIGIRLARAGYQTATIDLPTLEEAPSAPMPWLRQRTRWLKGWMQTWLVHMRHPAKCARDLGWRGFLGFHLVCTGLIASALIHPVYVALLAAVAADPVRLWGDGGVFACAVIGLNLFNLFAGYAAFVMLAARSLALRRRSVNVTLVLLLPFYWLLISLAAYRALLQLCARPHHWDKTPHRARSSVEPTTRDRWRPRIVAAARLSPSGEPRRAGAGQKGTGGRARPSAA